MNKPWIPWLYSFAQSHCEQVLTGLWMMKFTSNVKVKIYSNEAFSSTFQMFKHNISNLFKHHSIPNVGSKSHRTSQNVMWMCPCTTIMLSCRLKLVSCQYHNPFVCLIKRSCCVVLMLSSQRTDAVTTCQYSPEISAGYIPRRLWHLSLF